MALFDDALFDDAIFDVGDTTTVATSVDPLRQSRWLLTLDISGRVVRYSDLAGEVAGDLYRSAIANVSVGDSGIDLQNRSFNVGDVSIDLVPDPHGINPRFDLRRAKARLSVLVKGVVIDLLEGPVQDVRRGRSWVTGHVGEVHSFRITETFTRNPDFPPRRVDKERFPEVRSLDSVEGQVMTQVFGDALAVPMIPLTTADVGESAGQRYLIAGHRLKGGQPAPSDGMPWDEFPDRSELTPNQVVGLWVHTNRGIRDTFRNSALNAGWQATGTVTEGASGVDVAAGATLHWNQWRNQKPLSFAVSVENNGAGSGANRGFSLRWGWVDTDNYLAATFDVPSNTVILTAVRGGVTEWTSETWQPDTALVDTLTEYRLIVDEGGSVTIGVGDQRHSFEGSVEGVHTGHLMLAALVETYRFSQFRMPHQKPKNIVPNRLNLGIQNFEDATGTPYVAEEYEEELNETIYAECREAQGVATAGELYRTLITRYSGYTSREIDEASLTRATRALPLRVASYFHQRAKLFDVIQQRLAPQFLAWPAQEAGLIRVYSVNPADAPVRHLRLHRDLLEMVDQPSQLPDYTRFKASYRYRENRVVGAGFAREKSLGPDDSGALLAHENRLPGPVEFDTLELTDVIHDATVGQILSRYATLFHQGEVVQYLRRTDPKPLVYGTTVEITDEPNGYDRQRAVLLRRRYESPDFMVETYQTVHPLEDPIVAGTPETVVAETTLLISEGWDVDLVTPTQTLISEGWES